MQTRFVIVEDDEGVRKVLKNVIKQHALGVVIDESDNGLDGERLIKELRPDVALVDFLLPQQDGMQILKNIRRSTGQETSIIIISKVNTESLISEAYSNGIEFFIHKPINIFEMVSVINTVQEKRNLKQLMSVINQTASKYFPLEPVQHNQGLQKEKLYQIFAELGIIGELGTKEIIRFVQLISAQRQTTLQDSYQLLELYKTVAQEQNEDSNTIKQRIRRAVGKAMSNTAGLGADDYYNEIFQKYSSALFDFPEIRIEIDYIHKKSAYHGKVNIKKFLEGLSFISAQ